MLLRPNPSSGVPIYLQLMEQVKHAIETGALRPGEQLPGIRPLAEELVINPNTSREMTETIRRSAAAAGNTIGVEVDTVCAAQGPESIEGRFDEKAKG